MIIRKFSLFCFVHLLLVKIITKSYRRAGHWRKKETYGKSLDNKLKKVTEKYSTIIWWFIILYYFTLTFFPPTVIAEQSRWENRRLGWNKGNPRHSPEALLGNNPKYFLIWLSYPLGNKIIINRLFHFTKHILLYLHVNSTDNLKMLWN